MLKKCITMGLDIVVQVVGTERKVSLDDRNNLPYTQAVLMESMRMASLVPNGLSHSVDEDLKFGGYTFPKVKIEFIKHQLYLNDLF